MVEPGPTTGAEALALLKARLLWQNIAFESVDHEVIVRKLDEYGFDLIMRDDGREAMVESECGWHGHFGDAVEAVEVFFRLLGPSMRVVVTTRGDSFVGARAEFERKGQWERFSSISLLVPGPLWRKKVDRIYQNRIVPAAH